MSLISLLIALAAERYLSSSAWQFSAYYSRYHALFQRYLALGSPSKSVLANSIFLLLPVIGCYFLLSVVDNSLIHLVISTLLLILCFGCVKTRDIYKQYLMAAFRGETTTCDMHHKQLLQDKNLPDMGFGQALIWLNYRYFIAIMIFFVVFGAPGALFYRLLSQLNEASDEQESEKNETDEPEISNADKSVDDTIEATTEYQRSEDELKVSEYNQQLLFWLDWLPVRMLAFGYMLVGHFSRALPVWLENFFDVGKLPHNVLISVAEKSEDFMVDVNDCTAEPCLLVRLAKRSLLLCFSIIALLILTGVIS
ncbi:MULTISPECIES: beta-lactamase regulator AmpE [Thalassotalea]|uniref:Beta-lactamase regulator AmpE n=1 Tax=Thalassotalea castellviae TaxID=3075612 RepID=A0ABU3A0I3_9GAMM|nr:beta-lactamase regulator AmpE [Thalassotalea sp. W431]MDT0603378.1 beta-lactamase regulator AmpE [Thalassotalea sp. W431]